MRYALHIALFVLAGIVFFIGLVLGLQYDPNLGTLLWGVALFLVIVNLLWRPRSRD